MPKSLKGQKCLADMSGKAVRGMQIAMCEVEEKFEGAGKQKAIAELGLCLSRRRFDVCWLLHDTSALTNFLGVQMHPTLAPVNQVYHD